MFFTVAEKELGEHLDARDLTGAEKAFILTLNPGHILAFARGSSKVPATGFLPSPKLTFVHDETNTHALMSFRSLLTERIWQMTMNLITIFWWLL